MQFRPVYFSASCLHCHGEVSDAPKALLAKYGDKQGFGHKVGDLAGVVAIGIPVDIALGQLKGKAFAVFMSCLFAAGVLYVIISSFFNRLVAGDLRKILDIFRQELPETVAAQSLPESLPAASAWAKCLPISSGPMNSGYLRQSRVRMRSKRSPWQRTPWLRASGKTRPRSSRVRNCCRRSLTASPIW